MRVWIAVVLFSVLVFEPGAMARLSVTAERPEEDVVTELLEQYAKAADLKSYAASLAGRMSAEDSKFLMAKAEAVKGPKPVVKRLGPVELTVESEQTVIAFKVVSSQEGRYRVNGKLITVQPGDSFQTLWPKLQAALPLKKSAGLLEHLLPRAEATIVGELVAYGAFLVVIGAGTWTIDNIRACDRFKSASRDCRSYLGEVNSYARRDNRTAENDKAEAEKAARWQVRLDYLKVRVATRSVPYCPSKSPEAWNRCYEQFGARARELYGDLFTAALPAGPGVLRPVPASR
ncbi:MAG TPA: hypothetical protein VFV50_14365 [Bdellovibrionales bacterium]|nr:hypothetical protein [Bdellovibrionales bacterium]